MAYENVNLVTFIAGEDLRNAGPVLLKIENDGGVGKVVKTTNIADSIVGVLAENPDPTVNTDGHGVSVALLIGKIQMIAGAPISAGQLVGPSSYTIGTAYGVVGTTNIRCGIALKSVVTGDVFPVLAQWG